MYSPNPKYLPHPKKLALGSGATAALLAAFLIGGVALNHASAAPAPMPGTASAAVTPASPSAPEANEPTLDATTVKIIAAQAKAAALARFPGATIQRAELQDENGTPIWRVTLTDASGNAHDLKVDGTSGQVLSVEAGGADGSEGPETAGN